MLTNICLAVFWLLYFCESALKLCQLSINTGDTRFHGNSGQASDCSFNSEISLSHVHCWLEMESVRIIIFSHVHLIVIRRFLFFIKGNMKKISHQIILVIIIKPMLDLKGQIIIIIIIIIILIIIIQTHIALF